MANIEKYIVTGTGFPDWFIDGSARGLVRVVNDEDGVFDHVLVNTPTGKKIANKGDVVIKTRSGFSVMTEEQAKKYRVSVTPKKEVKEDEVKE